MKHFGNKLDEDSELKVIKRGAFPLGGGEIYFTCPIIKNCLPFRLTDEGKVLKIRGIA